MADPATDPNQQDLVLQQYSAARQQLAQRKKTAEQQLGTDLQRRQAVGGLTGGAVVKGQQLGEKSINDTFGTQDQAINQQQAQALQQIQATKEAQQFQTGERVAGQQFVASQTA